MPPELRFPDFFIVGAQRSGTTSLYEYLRQHSRVFMSPHKEPHFFSQDRVCIDADLSVQSETAYLRLFAGGADKLLGEASPSYLWHPEVAVRIHARQPGAKIIAVLRNPITRAFSQYRMDLADGMAATPFYDLIVRDDETTEKFYGTGQLYVELGLYAEQLRRYYDVFGPDDILVLAFDDLQQHTQETLRRVAAFLGLDASEFDVSTTFEVHNRHTISSSGLVRQLMHHRSLRRTYRAFVPAAWRSSARKYVFNIEDSTALDKRSFDYLHARYSPYSEALQVLCNISFPELQLKMA
jgi:hypothetical protein